MIVRRKLYLVPLSILFIAIFLSIPAQWVSAYSHNDLIDDTAFDNVNSMSAAKIDAWLNTFSNSCISSNNGFKAPDPTGYTPDANFVDGRYSYGGAVTAGTVIHDVAVGHSINPQVLLTKLENEENLVTGVSGCSTWRYASAVGYACPDNVTLHNYTYTSGADPYSDSSKLVTPLYYKNGTPVNSISGTCVNSNVKAGFSEQVVHMAWMLSYARHKSEGQVNWAAITGNWNHCDDNDTCPAAMNIPASYACYPWLMTQGTFKRCPTDSTATYYDGYTTIDGTAVHLDTGGTAALYTYTPHFQSFDSIYTPWFGNPTTLCTGTGNLSGFPTGRELITTHFASRRPSQISYTMLNNTGSSCAEVHTMNTGSNAWKYHNQTMLRALDPSTAEFIAGDFNGDGKDELLYVVFDGPGHVVNIRTLNSSYSGFVGSGAATPISGFDPAKDELLAADLYGNGHDELVYVVYNGPGSALNFRVLTPDFKNYAGTGVKTILGNFDPAKEQIVFGDMNGDGRDELLYVVYNGPGSVVNVRTLSSNYHSYADPGHKTPIANFSTSTNEFLTGDMYATGRDQLIYVVYCGPGGKVNTRTLNSNYNGYADSGTMTPLNCYNPST